MHEKNHLKLKIHKIYKIFLKKWKIGKENKRLKMK